MVAHVFYYRHRGPKPHKLPAMRCVDVLLRGECTHVFTIVQWRSEGPQSWQWWVFPLAAFRTFPLLGSMRWMRAPMFTMNKFITRLHSESRRLLPTDRPHTIQCICCACVSIHSYTNMHGNRRGKTEARKDGALQPLADRMLSISFGLCAVCALHIDVPLLALIFAALDE